MSRHRTIQRETSQKLASKGQYAAALIVIVIMLTGFIFRTHATAQVLIVLAMLFYVLFVGMKLILAVAAWRYQAPEYAQLSDDELPTYTLFVPLYMEGNMLPSLVRSIKQLDYPKRKLQVLLLLEARDPETIEIAHSLNLPSYFEVVVVPDIKPYGKPKALNLGLERATGDLCVIYDAEDRPDVDQLRKAAGTFHLAPDDVVCLQARLYFWNQTTSWVTRFYWVEYIVHFEMVLPGFAKLGLIPPLGGTSNHFRTSVLKEVAFHRSQLPEGAEGIGGWDPWNVTEDAELAGALALYGYRVLMFDSTTLEEATATMRIADPQRRRWLKGYLQTGLASTRQPVMTARQMGPFRWFYYNLLMLGTPLSLVLNPVFWTLTVVYFLTRSKAIESLYPAPLFYTGVFLIVVGNLMLFMQLVVACHKREGYTTVKYLVLTPVWWAFTSWSMLNVLVEMARPSKRHVWHKTMHGHDLEKEEMLSSEEEQPAVSTYKVHAIA